MQADLMDLKAESGRLPSRIMSIRQLAVALGSYWAKLLVLAAAGSSAVTPSDPA